MSSVVVECEYFKVTLQDKLLKVLSVPLNSLSKCSWWLFREFGGLSIPSNSSFRSFIMDADGLSVICDSSLVESLQYLLGPDEFCAISPQNWCALVINITGSAFDFPSAVFQLSNSLSSQGLSIFHISTFESEVFFVQSGDVEQACSILRDSDRLPRRRLSSGKMTLEHAMKSQALQLSTVPSASPDLSEFSLAVLPSHVVLARLAPGADQALCSQEMMRLLLFDERFSWLERQLTSSRLSPLQPPPPNNNSQQASTFLWGAWQCDGETTLLLDETSLSRFAPLSLETSPQKWRAVKLQGPPIPFSVTGVVSAMNRIATGIPSLNISTATSNYTLVPEETLRYSLRSLGEAMQQKSGDGDRGESE